jgi:eukaryotic-like serine/threonine-protein kinase
LNPESYARVKRVFREAIALEAKELPGFLDEQCADDAEVRAEVEALLRNHRPDTILNIKGVPAARPPARFRHATSLMARGLSSNWRQHRRVTVTTFVLLISVLGLSAWLAGQVEIKLIKAAGTSLENAVYRTSSSVRHWAWNRELSLLWARDPEVRHPIGELRKLLPPGPRALSAQHQVKATATRLHASDSTAQLRDGLAPHIEALTRLHIKHNAEVGYLVFDFETERLIASSALYSDWLALEASPDGHTVLDRCWREGLTFQLPFRVSGMFRSPLSTEDPAVISYAAPIYLGEIKRVMQMEKEHGRPEAVLLLVVTPALRLGDFSQLEQDPEQAEDLLSSPADTFMFDADGRLLSNLKCDEELRQAGLLDEGDRDSALDLELLDPGRELKSPEDIVPAGAPPTRLIAAAESSKARAGSRPNFISEPYRDALGREVIGAWLWIDELDVGIATEVEHDFVFSSLQAIERAERGLLGLIILLAIVAFYSSHSAEVLSIKVSEGEKLGQYTLLELIGEGGLGRVYKARHAMLQRITAVKLLRKELITEAAEHRFEREVRQTSRLTHPNTIQIYDYGRSEAGVFYYAMEYLSGFTLAELLKREPVLPIGRAIYILRKVLGSLAEAHAAGLIHRDIKPENIMLNRRGGQCDVVKVLDFGLVKSIETDEETALTAEGMISGTPLYIAPDRFSGDEHPDGRTDLYAVATVGFRMLTGRPPFDADNKMELCLAVMKDPVPRISAFAPRPIPPALEDLIYKAMSKKPGDRPSDADQMIEVLDELQRDFPWGRRESTAWWDEHEPLVE